MYRANSIKFNDELISLLNRHGFDAIPIDRDRVSFTLTTVIEARSLPSIKANEIINNIPCCLIREKPYGGGEKVLVSVENHRFYVYYYYPVNDEFYLYGKLEENATENDLHQMIDDAVIWKGIQFLTLEEVKASQEAAYQASTELRAQIEARKNLQFSKHLRVRTDNELAALLKQLGFQAVPSSARERIVNLGGGIATLDKPELREQIPCCRIDKACQSENCRPVLVSIEQNQFCIYYYHPLYDEFLIQGQKDMDVSDDDLRVLIIQHATDRELYEGFPLQDPSPRAFWKWWYDKGRNEPDGLSRWKDFHPKLKE